MLIMLSSPPPCLQAELWPQVFEEVRQEAEPRLRETIAKLQVPLPLSAALHV